MYDGYPWVMLPKSLIFDIFSLSDFLVMPIPGIIFALLTQKYFQEYFISQIVSTTSQSYVTVFLIIYVQFLCQGKKK